MIRLLITGKNSFVGESVKKYLESNDTGFFVDTIDVHGAGWRETKFNDYDCVLHVAGIAHIINKPSMEQAYWAVNRDLAIEVAKKAKRDGVRQFIFMSTMCVYGDAAKVGTRRLICIDDAPAPATIYAKSKLAAEDGIEKLADEGFTAAIIRSPMIYGAGCKGNYNTLCSFVRKLGVFPNIENQRSAIYIENLCEFLRRLMLKGSGGVFFPRNAQNVSTTAFVREIANTASKRMRYTRAFNVVLKLLGSGGYVRRAFGDMAYDIIMPGAEHEHQLYSFEESIRRTQTQKGDMT